MAIPDRWKRAIDRIWIFGGLVYCRPADYLKASRELFVLIVFGTAAFWLSAVLLYFAAQSFGKPDLPVGLKDDIPQR